MSDSPLLVDETVESWRREKRQSQVRLTSEAVDDLVEAYQSGTPCADLAARFGINESTVFAHLKRRKVERRPYRKLRGEPLELAVSLYRSGSSLRASRSASPATTSCRLGNAKASAPTLVPSIPNALMRSTASMTSSPDSTAIRRLG